jgi:hypothetical protein
MNKSGKRKPLATAKSPGIVGPKKEKERVAADKFQRDMKLFMDEFDEPNLDLSWDEEHHQLASKMTKERMLEEITSLPADETRKLLIKLFSEGQGVRETLRRELVKLRVGPDVAPAKKTRGALKGKKSAPFEWVGSYEVYSADLADQCDVPEDGVLKFTFLSSLGSSHLWGSFDIGVIKGVIRSLDPPPRAVGDKINFVWRGRETAEGEMRRDDDRYRGVVVFLGDAGIQGSMVSDAVFEQFSFLGKLKNNMMKLGKSEHRRKVEKMKSEWRGLCYSMERPDSPADSDTSWGPDMDGSGDDAGDSEGDGDDRSEDSEDSDEERGGGWSG